MNTQKHGRCNVFGSNKTITKHAVRSRIVNHIRKILNSLDFRGKHNIKSRRYIDKKQMELLEIKNASKLIYILSYWVRLAADMVLKVKIVVNAKK